MTKTKLTRKDIFKEEPSKGSIIGFKTEGKSILPYALSFYLHEVRNKVIKDNFETIKKTLEAKGCKISLADNGNILIIND